MEGFNINKITRGNAINELCTPLEKIGNKIIDSSYSSVFPKKEIGADLLTREFKIKSYSANYKQNLVYNKLGGIINLTY